VKLSIRRHGALGLALLFLGLASCQSAMPGYRHEGEGPDERLLALVDAMHARDDAGGGDSNPHLVDGGRIHNELRQLHLEFPTHAATLFTLATVEVRHGRVERAVGYLDDLASAQPAHPEAGLLRSRLAIREGNLNAARRVLEQQVRYTPDHAGLREALGSVAFLEGDLEQARAELEMARRLGAPDWRVEFNLGLVAEADDDRQAAMGHYELALDEDPEFRPAASRLAGLRAESGDVVR